MRIHVVRVPRLVGSVLLVLLRLFGSERRGEG
jgi:hypothetical protein